MAIKEYKEGELTFYEVYVNYRSKVNSKIRTQKRIRWIETRAIAEKLHKQALVECIEEAKRGKSWLLLG